MTKYITYNHIPDLGTVTAESLDWEQTAELVPELMRLTAAAYIAEFSTNLQQVPADDIRQHYDPEDSQARNRFLERTHDIYKRGAVTTVVRYPYDKALRGYMKFGPAPELTRNDVNPRYPSENGGYDYTGYYLNNIIVDPGIDERGNQHAWNSGLGTLLMHAGFTVNGYDPEQPVVLDAFNISTRINAWYERMGFVPEPNIRTEGMQFGQTELPQTYYVTPDNHALGGLLQYLETRVPELQEHIVY